MATLKFRYQIMLLSAIVLAVYYPTISAEICLVDDYGAILSVFNDDNLSLSSLFLPRNLEGGYYRPLIGVSYLIDKKLWFLDEHLMHFEGIIAHLVNGVLVFFLCREIVRMQTGTSGGWAPFFGAMLFSLHPACTESVNWISGRTDIMMGTFILGSVNLLLRYRQAGQPWRLVLGLLSALVAIFAKEAAFGYLVGMPLLLWYRPVDVVAASDPEEGSGAFNPILFIAYYACAVLIALFTGFYWLVVMACGCYWAHLVIKRRGAGGTQQHINVRRCVTLLAIGGVTVLLGVALRRMAFVTSVAKIGQTVSLMFADLNYTITLFIGAIGFYVKKFFWPLPLNFYIVEIDPLYDFVGIAVGLFGMHLLVRRKLLTSIMVMLGFLLLAPALPFAFGTIAWTGYAERYIYLPTAFWVSALVVSVFRWVERSAITRRVCLGMLLFACLVSAVATYERNRTWQSNVTLLRDTVEQSPKRRNLRDMYIQALISSGQILEAEREYRYVSAQLPSADGDVRAALMLGDAFSKKGGGAKALALYQDALVRAHDDSEPLLAAAVSLLRTLEADLSILPADRVGLEQLRLGYEKKLYAMTRNPLLLIEAGTAALKAGAYSAAYSSFDSALRYMKPDDRLRRIAEQRKHEASRYLEH